jgi:hypothetical protein
LNKFLDSSVTLVHSLEVNYSHVINRVGVIDKLNFSLVFFSLQKIARGRKNSTENCIIIELENALEEGKNFVIRKTQKILFRVYHDFVSISSPLQQNAVKNVFRLFLFH